MARFLTTFCEEVAKTVAIRNSGAPPLSLGSPGSRLSLLKSRSPGVLQEQAIPRRTSRGFAGMRFANDALFDHLDAGMWSKSPPFAI